MIDSLKANPTEALCEDVDTQCQQPPNLVWWEGRAHACGMRPDQTFLQVTTKKRTGKGGGKEEEEEEMDG